MSYKFLRIKIPVLPTADGECELTEEKISFQVRLSFQTLLSDL